MNSAAVSLRSYFAYVPFYLFVLAATMLLLLAVIGNGDWPGAGIPAILAALLAAYLAFEVRREINRLGFIAIASPAVLASFMTFFVAYSLPVLASFGDDFLFRITIRWIGSFDIMGWITYGMVLTCVSAVAYWQGYRLPFAKTIAGSLRSGGWTRLIRPELNLRMHLLFIFYLASIGAKLAQIQLGVFGYAANSAALIESAAYRQGLDAVSGGGRFALFLIALHVFQPRAQQSIGWFVVLAAISTLEVLFGILSGFKGPTILPIITVGFAYFLVRGRVSFATIALSVVVLFVAYSVVEPFRRLRYSDLSFDSTSVTSIVDTIVEAASDNSDRPQSANSGILSTVGHRAEYVSMTAATLWFEDTHEDLGVDPPAFLTHLVMAPVYAVMPRIIWKDKPLANFGLWFDRYVLNGGDLERENSVGMGPVSYFYFAGGIPMIVIGFLGLGLLHRILFETLPALGIGGGLMYIAILQNTSVINSEVGAWLAGLIQSLVVVYLAQAIFLKPSADPIRFDLRSAPAE